MAGLRTDIGATVGDPLCFGAQVFDLGACGNEPARRVAEVSNVYAAAASAPGGRELFRGAASDRKAAAVKYIAPIGELSYGGSTRGSVGTWLGTRGFVPGRGHTRQAARPREFLIGTTWLLEPAAFPSSWWAPRAPVLCITWQPATA